MQQQEKQKQANQISACFPTLLKQGKINHVGSIFVILYFVSMIEIASTFTLLPSPCENNQLDLNNGSCIKCYQFGTTIQRCSSSSLIAVNTQIIIMQADLMFHNSNLICTFKDSNKNKIIGCCDNYFGCLKNTSVQCHLGANRSLSDYTNCYYCQNATNCTICKDGYGLNIRTSADNVTYIFCSPCTILNCKRCSSYNTSCQLCEAGYYMDDGPLCLPCNSNCRTCYSWSPSCDSCPSGFVLSGGSCISNIIPCPLNSTILNCNTCLLQNNFVDVICIQCINGYFLNALNSTCQRCFILQPNCTSCYLSQVYGTTLCRKCGQGYYLYSDGRCHSCSQINQTCLDCLNSNVCTQCIINYSSSALGSSSQIKCDLCSSLMNNCQKCSSNTTCLWCNSTSYFINSSTSQCDPCIQPCLTCQNNNGSFCYSCIDKNLTGDIYIFNQAANLCPKCSDLIVNCLDCTSLTKCITCTNDNVANILDNGKTCVPCSSIHPNCVLCQDDWTCLECNSTFYANRRSKTCQMCVSPCFECSDQFTCISCLSTEVVLTNLTGSTCEPCRTLITNCLTCENNNNVIECIMCYNNAVLVTPAKTCSLCGIAQFANYSANVCVSCTTPCYSCINSTECKSCLLYYQLSVVLDNTTSLSSGQTICVQICGDQIVYDLPCDLAKGNGYDGCTDTCSVEDMFVCDIYDQSMTDYSVMYGLSASFIQKVPMYQSFSVCSYSGSIKMKVVRIQRALFKNQISVTLELLPFLYVYNFLTTQDLKQMFTIVYNNDQNISTSAIQSLEFSIDSKTNQIHINIHYTESLLNPIQIFMDHFNLTDPRYFATGTSSIALTLVDQNQMSATYVDPSELTFSETLYYAMNGMGYLGIVGSLAGLVTGVTAGLQFAWVLQTMYSSLFWYNDTLSPPIYSYLGLFPINGYNMQGQIKKNYDQLVINSTRRLLINQQPILPSLTPQFQQNFNIMVSAFVLPLFLGFICTIISLISSQSCCILIFIKLSNFFVFQLLFFSVLFQMQYLTNLVIIFFSAQNLSSSFLWSWILLATCLVIIFIVIVKFVCWKSASKDSGQGLGQAYANRYGSFVNGFNDNVPLLGRKLYLLYIVALIASTLSNIFWVSYPLMPFLIYAVVAFLVLFYSPYIRPSSNVRAALCMLTISYSYFIRIIYEYSLKSDPISMNVVMCIWLGLALISFVWIIVQIYFNIKERLMIKQTKQQEFNKKIAQKVEGQNKLLNNMMIKEYKSLSYGINNSLLYDNYYQPNDRIQVQVQQDDDQTSILKKYSQARQKLKPKPMQKNDVQYNSFKNNKKRQAIYPQQQSSQRRKLIDESLGKEMLIMKKIKQKKKKQLDQSLQLLIKSKQLIERQQRISKRKMLTSQNKQIQLKNIKLQSQKKANQKQQFFQNVIKTQVMASSEGSFPKIQFFFKQSTKIDLQKQEENVKKRQAQREHMLKNDFEKKCEEKYESTHDKNQQNAQDSPYQVDNDSEKQIKQQKGQQRKKLSQIYQ